MVSDHLDSLATVAERLEDLGVGVEEIVGIDDYRQDDHLTVDVSLAVPAELDRSPAEPEESGDQSADDESKGGGNQEFECPHCDYTTDSERGLNIHIARVHDSDEDNDADDGSNEEQSSQRVPDWVADDPADIVEESPARRTVQEVLDEVERQGNRLDIHRRLAMGGLNQTTTLLDELGLLTEAGDELREDVDARVERLREVTA